MENKSLIVIAGPTAVGKTALAVELARYLQTDIISADSRQCFKELEIGVAKPSITQLQQVHHYFVNSHSIHEEVHAALFERSALGYAAEIFKEKDVAVMVGGTGLYIKAFCEGLDEMPVTDMSIRQNIQSRYDQEGIAWLQAEVKENDPLFYASGEIRNPQRLMRALEVKLSTGRSIESFRSKQKKQRPFRTIKVGLAMHKESLHRNINTRVDNMMQEGLLDEVKNLLPVRHLNALQTVGYAELFDHLDGRLSLDEAIALVKKNTRHYAKRQLTWFRKDADMQWIAPGDWEALKKITQS